MVVKYNPKSSDTSLSTYVSPGGFPQNTSDLFNYIVNHIGDEVLLINADGGIAYANQAAIKGLGYAREALLNKNITDFFKDKISVEKWQKTQLTELKKAKAPLSFEAERIVKNGQVETVEITAVYMPYDSKEYVLSVIRDITSRIKNEERIHETDKMKALSLFVSGTAQEIIHPLRAILTHTQSMMHKYRNRDFEYISFKEFKDIMNTIHTIGDQVRHCYDITNKLLILHKRKIGTKRVSCDVNSVIRNTLGILAQQLKLSNVKLNLKLTKNPTFALIDTNELDEVITNIVSNALQAMPSGGLLRIRTAIDHQLGNIHIEFKDNGIGIPKEILPRIFEPFFTTKERGSGKNSGLGLSVVYSIVKECRGDVLIESSQREGTTVTVILLIAKKQFSRKA